MPNLYRIHMHPLFGGKFGHPHFACCLLFVLKMLLSVSELSALSRDPKRETITQWFVRVSGGGEVDTERLELINRSRVHHLNALRDRAIAALLAAPDVRPLINPGDVYATRCVLQTALPRVLTRDELCAPLWFNCQPMASAAVPNGTNIEPWFDVLVNPLLAAAAAAAN